VLIQAVTFDVGGTLIQPWPSVGHVYAEVAARHGVRNVPPELLNARFKAAWRARKNFDHSRAGWEQLVDQVFDGLTPESPGNSFFPELYERFAQPEAWQVFEDVRSTLAALAARGIRLGIISNWDERLRGLLPRLGLETYFETIVISCEAGAAKPAAAIFNQAASRLGLGPESILHVGDSLEMDVQGAEHAGFRARQILRDQGKVHPKALASLTDLMAEIAGPQPKID
jgi:putative hydrolase of the HAD superfamily